MILIDAPLVERPDNGEDVVSVITDRRTLAKRRWRGTAEDGTEFGFDLHHGLEPGAVIHRSADGKCYMIAQAPEPVLEISLPEDRDLAISLAWQIGNLHFPLQVHNDGIRTADDPAARQMLDRAGIEYRADHAIFQALVASSGGHHHEH